ncbi:MAG TPA: hypothetical protein VE641_01535, partial [Chthoniobacterales bacterium]|nr:hypothetical protein [Chthoniobacterales bacterium]
QGEESSHDRAATRSPLPLSRKKLSRCFLPQDEVATRCTRSGHRYSSQAGAYCESVLVRCDRQENTRAEMRLGRQATNLGYMLSLMPEL